MAIDTLNEKLALLGEHLPVSADGLDQADNQQLLWGYPGLLWGALSLAVGKVTITWSATQPGVTWSATQPGITWSGKQPNITWSSD